MHIYIYIYIYIYIVRERCKYISTLRACFSPDKSFILNFKISSKAAVSVYMIQKGLSVVIHHGVYRIPHLQLIGNPSDLFITIVQCCYILRHILVAHSENQTDIL
jgi:hypothetical protein